MRCTVVAGFNRSRWYGANESAGYKLQHLLERGDP
jgi:hypothetical protein